MDQNDANHSLADRRRRRITELNTALRAVMGETKEKPLPEEAEELARRLARELEK